MVLNNEPSALCDLMIVTESKNAEVNDDTDEEANVFNG